MVRHRLRLKGNTLYPLIDQAKRSFWNFSKKKKRNSHSKEEKAIITRKLEDLFADHLGGLTLSRSKTLEYQSLLICQIRQFKED